MNENNVEFTQKTENSLIHPIKETEGKAERKNPLDAYIGSEYLSMIRKQEKEGRPPAALFTDIDRTFYLDKRAEASKKLFKDLQQDSYPIVAVTGNSFSAIEKRIQSNELPYFPVIIGAVGTEIYVLHEENENKIYKKDEAYEKFLYTKDYNRPELAKKSQQTIDDLGGKNPQYQESRPEWKLQFQEPEKEQSYIEGKEDNVQPFKISFNAFTTNEASLEALKTQLQIRFRGTNVVICEDTNYNDQLHEDDTNKKYNIDILPITKGGAVDYIAEKTGVKFEVRAGDSGNDLEMLTDGKADVSVSVGGSRHELKNIVHKNIFGGEINKDFKKIIDANGKEKLHYLEIGTSRGPESIAKIFKDVKIMQESSTIDMLKKEEDRKKFQELLKKGRSRQT